MYNWENIRMPHKEDRLWELYHENSKTPKYLVSDPEPDHGVVEDLHRSLPVRAIREIDLTVHIPHELVSKKVTLGILSKVLAESWDDVSTGYRSAHLSPLEIYAFVNNVEGLDHGLYHMDKEAKFLRLVDESISDAHFAECLRQGSCGSVHLCFTAVFQRAAMQFGERGYRYSVTESGRLVQAVLHQVASCGLKATINFGYYERAVEDILGIDGVEHAILQIVEIQ